MQCIVGASVSEFHSGLVLCSEDANCIWCINDKYCFLCRLAVVKMFGKMLLMYRYV